MTVRYTVCTYYPNLTQVDVAYPFAVLAANPKEIALVGLNLGSAAGVDRAHVLASAVAGQTFDVVSRRVQAALKRSGVESCLDVLDRLVENNRSNIQFRSFVDFDAQDAKKVAELVFSGIREQRSRSAGEEAAQELLQFHQLVLRLAPEDAAAMANGMPAYSVFGLLRSAAQLVQSATLMFRGLRREGRLQHGFAFCGRLPRAYDNEGSTIDPPTDMVFIVYADPEGYIFDWDWVKEDPTRPGHPVDADDRFPARPEAVVPKTIILGVDDLKPTRFDFQHAWPSRRGDCIFCYFSDEFAYADRINNDLTVFRSVKSGDPTGFKIKNVERILEGGVREMNAPGLKVAVQAFLLETFRRNPKTNIKVYSMLIGAWMQQAAHAALTRGQHRRDETPIKKDGRIVADMNLAPPEIDLPVAPEPEDCLVGAS
jgi:hypothetical protein